MGAWRFMLEAFPPLLASSKRTIRYVGRPESASPAAGSEKRHKQEQSEIVEASFAPAVSSVKPRRTKVVRKKQ